MQLTQFKIKTINGFVVEGEYEGNVTSGKVIIFSHGFGVTRDSRGMFTEIGNELKSGYAIVRFDYTMINEEENWTKVFACSAQTEMLCAVRKYIQERFKPVSTNIIAHSMGCIITGLAQMDCLDKILLLASPPVSPYQLMKDYFSKRHETIIDETAISKIKRSDGSITYVESGFWREIREVDPPQLYSQLSKHSGVSFVRALLDEIITDLDLNYQTIRNITSINYQEIEGNHNFEGSARQTLINFIIHQLTH